MCRSCDEGGRRCTDRRSLRALDLADLQPAATADAPDVDWGNVPTVEDLYEKHGNAITDAALLELKRVAAIEPEITAAIIHAAPADCRMHGLEYRMKSPSSLASKISNRLDDDSEIHPREITSRLTDFVRYTVVAPDAARVTSAARETLTALTSTGWGIREIEHSFVDGNPYKGLHSIVIHHGATDQDVEIQFHSEAGIAIKDQYHVDYETLRDMSQPHSARAAAFDTMATAWSTVPTPPGLEDLRIGDVAATEKVYRRPLPLPNSTKTN